MNFAIGQKKKLFSMKLKNSYSLIQSMSFFDTIIIFELIFFCNSYFIMWYIMKDDLLITSFAILFFSFAVSFYAC